MNPPKFLLLIFTFSFFGINYLKADSPLTSTEFSQAYREFSIVTEALEQGGKINDKISKFLADKSKPIDEKMAVINALGWDINGKNNADYFFNYLKKKRKYKDLDNFLNKGRADELLCYAYLKAMDNYFDVKEAFKFAEKALSLNPKSYTFNIITALIKAQIVFRGEWCDVFKSTDAVRNNESLKMDMDESAIVIIFEYMDGYQEYCK
jgi:hypothetical protein